MPVRSWLRRWDKTAEWLNTFQYYDWSCILVLIMGTDSVSRCIFCKIMQYYCIKMPHNQRKCWGCEGFCSWYLILLLIENEGLNLPRPKLWSLLRCWTENNPCHTISSDHWQITNRAKSYKPLSTITVQNQNLNILDSLDRVNLPNS